MCLPPIFGHPQKGTALRPWHVEGSVFADRLREPPTLWRWSSLRTIPRSLRSANSHTSRGSRGWDGYTGGGNNWWFKENEWNTWLSRNSWECHPNWRSHIVQGQSSGMGWEVYWWYQHFCVSVHEYEFIKREVPLQSTEFWMTTKIRNLKWTKIVTWQIDGIFGRGILWSQK